MGLSILYDSCQDKNESTFCIKKMELKHTCPTEPTSTRVNAKWLSSAYVDEYKSNITTSITTLQDKAQKDFGVDVPKRMAYMARTKAIEMVMGGSQEAVLYDKGLSADCY